MDKKGRFSELEVGSIIVSESLNHRRVFEKQGLLDLGESMNKFSQLQPVIVNRVDGKNHLIAGERRLRAAKEAKIDFIEAKVYDDLDELTAIKMAISENHDRVKPNVIEDATAISQLFDHGVKEKEIAEFYKCSVKKIRGRLSLLKLPKDVRDLLIRNTNALPIHQALLLKNLPTSDQIQIARKAAPSIGPVATEAEVKKMVEDAVGPELPLTGPATGATASCNQPPEKPKTQTAAKTKDTASKIKPVAGLVGMKGKVTINDDGQVVIIKPTITIAVDGKITSAKILTEVILDVGCGVMEKVRTAINKAQPAPKAKAKKTAKKTESKKAKSESK